MGTKTRVPGTGLTIVPYVGLLVASVALFLCWGGVIWSAPRASSQVARFAVSYFAVIPLAALLIAWRSHLTWNRLITAVGTVWGLKLVITAALYLAVSGLRPGPAFAEPAPSPEAALAALAPPRAGAARFESGPFVAGAPPTVTLSGGRFSPLVVVAPSGGELAAHNDDPVLHTLRVVGLPALPLPPTGAGTALALPDEPGLYLMTCDNHPGERALVLLKGDPP